MKVDGEPIKILGSIVLKAVLIPQINSANYVLEIYQTWHDWIPDEIRSYMSDPRMQALKQFYRDIWSEDLKKDPEWIRRSPFERAEKTDMRKKDLAFLNEKIFATETTSNPNVKPVKAVTPQENDPQIAANGKLAMQLSGEIDNIKTKLKTADSATQVQLNTQLTELEKQLDAVKIKMRDLGVPTTEEFNKDPKYWISKATGVNMTPKATAGVSHGLSFTKGYNVENIEEMKVDGEPIKILGSIVLKAVLIPQINSANYVLEIYQTWHDWIPDEIRSYMSDPRMQALKQFYRDIWSEDLKKDPEWIRRSPFERACQN